MTKSRLQRFSSSIILALFASSLAAQTSSMRLPHRSAFEPASSVADTFVGVGLGYRIIFRSGGLDLKAVGRAASAPDFSLDFGCKCVPEPELPTGSVNNYLSASH